MVNKLIAHSQEIRQANQNLANSSIRLEGRPTKMLVDDGYSLTLYMAFDGQVAVATNESLIASILETDQVIWVEGLRYGDAVHVYRGGLLHEQI